MAENKFEKRYSALQSKVDILENEIKDFKKAKRKREGVGEWINIICSLIATVVAVGGIILTLYTSNEQKKVDLFEKRYESLYDLNTIVTFVNDYNETQWFFQGECTFIYNEEQGFLETSKAEYYCSLWEGRFLGEQNSTVNIIEDILYSQRRKIEQIPYLFENISDEDISRMMFFFDNYAFYTQMYVEYPKADYFMQVEEYEMERLECTIEDILRKLEEQTKIR